MKKFKVTASFSTYCTVEIFAKNEDDAYDIAAKMDGGQFEPRGSDSWTIESVDLIEKNN